MAGEVEGIRWGRALLGSVLLEVLLGLVAVPAFYLSADPAATLNLVVPPASSVVALLVVAWLFRNSARPIANGLTTGFISVLLYVLLGVVAYLVAPEQTDFSQSLGLPYLASHTLKILGGGAGGWWIARRRARSAAGVF